VDDADPARTRGAAGTLIGFPTTNVGAVPLGVLVVAGVFSGVFHRYTDLPLTSTVWSGGFCGPMSKLCDTTRVPGLSSLFNLGMSFWLSEGNR